MLPATGGFPGEVNEIPADALRLITDDGNVVTPGDVVRLRGVVNVFDDAGTIQCSLRPSSVVAL